MKVVVCIYRVLSGFGSPFDSLSVCRDEDNLPDDGDLGARVSNYFIAMQTTAISQFNNPLWTNTATSLSHPVDTDGCFVIGDGYLQLAEKAFDTSFEDRPTMRM